ncbi:MFS transporter [Zooshikella ganghwensis]|uniref:MFS transporter n=1 Tax=Zooshikella ganghwensis TaxID=202772 RepID=A0A4P9VLN6_9GAMM|nr:MFS transporter [Zooshikella ganghwensis]RDH44278.1 MFS transporter [Zooshikella ganghwensis]
MDANNIPTKSEGHSKRAVWSWAFYDWANSGFATVVLAGFFPLLFQDFWSTDTGPAESNLRLGWGNSIASVVIAMSAPILGAVADRSGTKKRFLFGSLLLGVIGTALLSGIEAGNWMLALIMFICASVGFMGANVFYDALLVSVAPANRWHIVSGLGFGLGYLGGGLLYLGCVIAALNPELVGLKTSTEAATTAFLVTAIWWTVFAIPLFLFVNEPAAEYKNEGSTLTYGFRQVVRTIQHIRQLKPVWMFLFAYWLYIDAVDTVIRMAVAYGRSLGFERQDLIIALLIVQFVGFPAAIAFGYLGERLGPKRGIYLGLLVYIAICIWGAFIRQPWEFYVIAVMVGLVQGGVQALSRSFYARLIPASSAGEFFGFYNLLGKFAALIGPPLFGLFGTWFGDVRYSMLSLIILLVGGGLLLWKVDDRS